MLPQFKISFPIEFKPLNEGQKFPGLRIKENSYDKVDWTWILQKVEGMIKHWTHKWLSLGGCLIMVKYIFKSILVYWFSLAHIPKGILNGIRKCFFSFLWNGRKKSSFHLACWETLDRPKTMGGWGLKKTYSLGKALVVKRLWICVGDLGLWGRITRYKYIFEWFCLETK